jgi:thiamine-monophosphate kinase
MSAENIKKNMGEFELIDLLTRNIKIYNRETVVGIGDDAAVLAFENEQILVTNDVLIEGIHFDLAYVPLKHLGYKAAIVNFSDVYAMNAKPKQLVVSIAVSNRFSTDMLQELYAGIKLACDNYKVDLVGGDTSSSRSGMFLSLTAIGSAPKNEIVYRNTAQKGDYICVSGDLGAAYVGLHLLKRENEIFQADPSMQPVLEGYDYILQRQLKPEARADIYQYLKQKEIIPTSMIDVSDGLSSEILHICNNSGTGCKIFENKIPIAPETESMADELGIDPTVCALNGGEDYELLFTVSQDDYEKLTAEPQISIIGHITGKDEGTNLISIGGNVMPLHAKGWNAFAKANNS